MKSKFLYAKTKEAFQRELPNIPLNLKPIVFIEDTKEIWVLGNYFSIGSPGVFVTEENNIITVEVGPHNFTMSASGDNIVIRKGTGNNIIFSSNALTSIDALLPLKWDSVNKKLSHEKTTVTPGNYGETSSSDNISLFTIPHFTVDEWGHIVNATNRNIKIRDYVEQNPSTAISGEYNLLLGYTNNELSETNIVRKALGLKFDTILKTLKIEGGIETGANSLFSGDLRVINGVIIGDVQGNVSGTATPKIHLSTQPEYGGASLNLYGHVKLQDTLIGVPETSSNNTDPNSPNVEYGVAASPYLVWTVKDALERQIASSSLFNKIQVNDELLNLLDIGDTVVFKIDNGLTASIHPTTKDIIIKGINITGYSNNTLITLQDSLEFSRDFNISGNIISLKWESKIIHADNKADFDTRYPNKAEIFNAIVVLNDGYIWTKGKYFKIFDDINPLFTASTNNSVITLRDANNNIITTFDRGIHTISATSPITSSTINGTTVIEHIKPFTANQVIGPTANANTSIVVPQITFNEWGHYVSTTNRTATLNFVLASNADTTNTTHYLVGSNVSTNATAQLYKTSKITFNPSTGLFNALILQENGQSLSGKYAPLSHIDVIGTDSISGHIKLSDSISSTSGILGGTAATPAAVKAVYDYARSVASANDAMVFKGTIGVNGIITGHVDVNGLTLSTIPAYSTGWTFKVSTAQTITGVGNVEPGDMIIAINPKGTTYNSADWTVVQANIDGAVIIDSNLLSDQLLIGGIGNTSIKSLAPGSNNQYLTIVNGKPTWNTLTPTYRPLFVDNIERLTNADLSALKLNAGTGISLGWNTTNKNVTISTSLQNLSIQNSGTALGSYNPTTTTNNTINFGTGLTASLSSNVFTVNHSNTVTPQAAQALRSISYDAQGHITGSTLVTSLPTANNLTFSDSKVTPTTSIFNGSNPLTVKFSPATGDINIIADTLTPNTINYTLGITQRYRPISYVPVLNGTITNIFSNTSNATLTIAPGNENISLAWANNQLKISAASSGRAVWGYSIGNVLAEVLSASSSTKLQLGDDFIWDNNEFNIGWAEVSATGTITYGY